MKFSTKISNISTLNKIKDSLMFLTSSDKIDTVLNNAKEYDIIIVNDNDIIISPNECTSFTDEIRIINKYNFIYLKELFYYTHLLKCNIDYIIDLKSYDEYLFVKKIDEYKKHNFYDTAYAIIINNDIHFINEKIYRIFFREIKTIDLNMFKRMVKIKQLI